MFIIFSRTPVLLCGYLPLEKRKEEGRFTTFIGDTAGRKHLVESNIMSVDNFCLQGLIEAKTQALGVTLFCFFLLRAKDESSFFWVDGEMYSIDRIGWDKMHFLIKSDDGKCFLERELFPLRSVNKYDEKNSKSVWDYFSSGLPLRLSLLLVRGEEEIDFASLLKQGDKDVLLAAFRGFMLSANSQSSEDTNLAEKRSKALKFIKSGAVFPQKLLTFFPAEQPGPATVTQRAESERQSKKFTELTLFYLSNGQSKRPWEETVDGVPSEDSDEKGRAKKLERLVGSF